jgi:hypothetical protein
VESKYLTLFKVTQALWIGSEPWVLLTKRIADWLRSFLVVSIAHNLSWQLKMIVFPSVAKYLPGVPKFSVVTL